VQGSSGQVVSLRGVDERALERAKAAHKGDFVWFTRDGKSYVVTDPAVVARARAAWAPVEQLGQRMERHGQKMGELGAKLGVIGAQLGEQHAAAGRDSVLRSLERRLRQKERELKPLGEEMEKLARQIDSAQAAGERDAIVARTVAIQRPIVPLQAEMDGIAASIAAQQGQMHPDDARIKALRGQMQELQRPMGELGRKMGELGRDHGLASQAAERTMRTLLDETLRRGTAQPAG
jgi:chromosome segregation ATPase